MARTAMTCRRSGRAASCAPTDHRASNDLGLLALLLAEREALAATRSAAPLMLLDDVMSELDGVRRTALVDLLRSGGGQSVITTTDVDHVPGARERRASCAARGRCCGSWRQPCSRSARGGPEAMSSVPVARSPRPIGLALEHARESGRRRRCWRRCSGSGRRSSGRLLPPRLAPFGERAGVVTVSCSASVWAQELDLMGPIDRRAFERSPRRRADRAPALCRGVRLTPMMRAPILSALFSSASDFVNEQGASLSAGETQRLHRRANAGEEGMRVVVEDDQRTRFARRPQALISATVSSRS